MIHFTVAAASHQTLSSAGEKPDLQQKEQLQSISHRRISDWEPETVVTTILINQIH